MSANFHFATTLDTALTAAATTAGFDTEGFTPEIRTTDPKHGDYQANGVLAYAKRARKNPRALATELVAALPEEITTDWEVTIAGPGFINFSLRPTAIGRWLTAFGSAATLATGAGTALAGRTWILDYSSPNTAKQMHVGHLRSAVIGEAIARLAAFCGAKVIRDNHIGDWGTQFGKIIWAYKQALANDSAALESALESNPLEEFERLYKVGNTASENEPDVLVAAREELVRLQAGDPESVAIWKHISAVSLTAFQRIYDQLDITFDKTLGESFYSDKVDQIYRELTEIGLAEESKGALVVFHDEIPRFSREAERPNPFMIRKADGAANYASTDLATILYRVETFGATDTLYVVDKRQSDHFEQLFLTAGKWFERTKRVLPRLEHVDFGTVLGENGRPLKTRDGENIKLKDLLNEAIERAFKLVTARDHGLTPAEQQHIADIVGVGSVQYADLVQNRSSDYLFSWDKMISLEGNTAAYLLYAIARIHSIFRKLEIAPETYTTTSTTPVTPAEIALARKLIKFADALTLATQQLRPHLLCLYLYDLAGEFSAFYAAEKVVVEDPVDRARRLQLCASTLLILETGLRLLGLRTLRRM